MARRCAPFLALLAVVAAGCGAHSKAPVAAPTVPVHTPAPAPRPHSRLVVRVVDGDSGRVVRGATVRIGSTKAQLSNPRGEAAISVVRRRPLAVTAGAPGYAPRSVQMPFDRYRAVTIRVYRTATQWPMYGVDPQRTQETSAIHLRPPFRTVWQRQLHAMVEFPAVVSDGVAYVTNMSGTVRALDMKDGSVLWAYRMHTTEQDSSPAVVDARRLVVHSKYGSVVVLDRRNGSVLWHWDDGYRIESSPIVIGGIDYFGDWGGRIFALDLNRHRVKWERGDGAKITSSASIDGNALFIGDYAGRLLRLDRRDGSEIWTGGVNGKIYGTPAVSGGRVYVPSSDGNSMSAFTTGGSHLWTITTGSYVYSSPAVWKGRVYFGSYNGNLYCVAGSTGSILWEQNLGAAISGSAAVIDGVVYAATFGDRIYGADAQTGHVLLRFPEGRYVAVSGNGSRLLLFGWAGVWAVEPRR